MVNKPKLFFFSLKKCILKQHLVKKSKNTGSKLQQHTCGSGKFLCYLRKFLSFTWEFQNFLFLICERIVFWGKTSVHKNTKAYYVAQLPNTHVIWRSFRLMNVREFLHYIKHFFFCNFLRNGQIKADIKF